MLDCCRLNAAQADLEEVMRNLREKQQLLASVEQKIAMLQKSYEDSVNEKQRLERNMALTQARLKRAGKLTTALADEKIRWEESITVSQSSLAVIEPYIGDTPHPQHSSNLYLKCDKRGQGRV